MASFIKLSPKELDELVDQANVQSIDGNYNLATEIYERCLASDKNHFPALANFAIQEMEIGHADKARELYERSLKLNPQWFEGQYNLGNLFADMGPEGESKAIERFLLAAKLNDRDADVWNNLSVCMNKAGKLKDALEYAKKAIRLDKNNELVLANLAELYNQQGDTKKALFFAQKCSTSSDSRVLQLMGTLFTQMGNIEEALKCYERICSSNSLELGARIRYFSVLGNEGQGEEARKALGKARDLYVAEFPKDKLGALAFRFFLGDYPSKEEVLRASKDQETLSQACEAFILHLGLQNASQLAHKCQIADNLKKNGLEDIQPKTFICQGSESVWDIINKEAFQGLWYLKDPAIQRGQGITILKRPFEKGVIDAAMPSDRRICLQEEVPPCLLQRRKFGVRIHVFVLRDSKTGTLQVKLCKEGILTMCGKEYSSDDQSALAQITCTSVQRAEADFDRAKVKGPASLMWDGFSAAFPGIEQAVLKTIQAVAGKLGVNESPPTKPCTVRSLSGQIFGYDFIFAQDGSPVFIEANLSPQFQDAKAVETLKETVAMPFMNGFVEALLLTDGETSEIWESHGWKDIGQVQEPAESN